MYINNVYFMHVAHKPDVNELIKLSVRLLVNPRQIWEGIRSSSSVFDWSGGEASNFYIAQGSTSHIFVLGSNISEVLLVSETTSMSGQWKNMSSIIEAD